MFWRKRIYIYADFIDPFCYIGFHGLCQAAGSRWPLEWRGFELNPDTPREGMPLEIAPNSDVRAGMWSSVAALAMRFGLRLHQPRLVPNTRLAHGLVQGVPHRVKIPLIERLYQAYFSGQSLNIGDPLILADFARDFGVSAKVTARALAQTAMDERLMTFRAEAMGHAFKGLPGFAYGKKTYFGAVSAEQWRRIYEH